MISYCLFIRYDSVFSLIYEMLPLLIIFSFVSISTSRNKYEIALISIDISYKSFKSLNLILNIFSGMASPLYTAEAQSSLFLNKKLAQDKRIYNISKFMGCLKEY